MSKETSYFNDANTEEINLSILGVLEEVCGNYLYHQITDERVDIVLDTGQNEPILIRLDDPEQHLIDLIKSLTAGEKVGIFKLDEPPKYYIRKIGKGIP